MKKKLMEKKVLCEHFCVFGNYWLSFGKGLGWLHRERNSVDKNLGYECFNIDSNFYGFK